MQEEKHRIKPEPLNDTAEQGRQGPDVQQQASAPHRRRAVHSSARPDTGRCGQKQRRGKNRAKTHKDRDDDVENLASSNGVWKWFYGECSANINNVFWPRNTKQCRFERLGLCFRAMIDEIWTDGPVFQIAQSTLTMLKSIPPCLPGFDRQPLA